MAIYDEYQEPATIADSLSDSLAEPIKSAAELDAVIDSIKTNSPVNLNAISNIVNPDESDSQYNMFNSNNGLLQLAKKGAPLAALGGAAYMGKSAIPRNMPRHLANHAMNFLEGFYQPGANKSLLYAQELGKSIGRLGYAAVNPREAISYANTGVSRLIEQKIKSLPEELNEIDKKYLAGEYGESGDTAIKKAKQAKNKLIKERHYKVLNDAANREIFGGKKSRLLENYRKRKPHLKNYWDHDVIGAGKNTKYGQGFLKSAGSLDKANYLTSRHSIGHGELPGVGRFFKNKKLLTSNPNLRYIKWFDNSISGVLRGAQFNYKTYEILEALKRNRMNQGQALSALKSAGINPYLAKDGKIMFSFSPSIKSNFDWGGYNAVAEWDYKKPGRVRFHATDLRDTPISSIFKGKNVLNYVESKEIDIAKMKDHVDKETKPNFVRKDKLKTKPTKLDPKKLLTRQQILDSGQLESGGQYKTIRKDLDKIAKGKARSRDMVKLKTISKNMLKYGKYATKGLSAAGLASLALMLLNKD